MSEARQARSISGPKARQEWINGRADGAVKKAEVWRDEIDIEPLGETSLASEAVFTAEVLVLPHESLQGELKGETVNGSESSWQRCIEVKGRRYAVEAAAEEHLDGAPVMRLTLPKPGLLNFCETGEPVRILTVTTRKEYYGTFHCISRQADAYARKLEVLEREWRTANRLPRFAIGEDGKPIVNALPESVKEEMEIAASVGTYIVGFEDFCDDSGPIPPHVNGGSLNESGLLEILKIKDFQAALEDFYREEKFDYDLFLAEKKMPSKSSNGI